MKTPSKFKLVLKYILIGNIKINWLALNFK